MLTGKGILSRFQATILRAFARMPDSNQFYLTGGTALAEFYLEHRRSFDLDLFTPEVGLVLPFSRALEVRLPQELPLGAKMMVIRRFESFVEFEIGSPEEIVRVQLAVDSPFRFRPPEESEYGVLVNDFEDITVDKLLAYFGRTETRDAVDLFFILKQLDAQTLIDRAQKKDPGFDRYWMAIAFEKASQFPDDIRRWPVSMIAEIDVRELKQTFSQLATQLLDQIRVRPKKEGRKGE